MMSSSSSAAAVYTTSYPQIDHRTVVFKSSQLEENQEANISRGSSKETLISVDSIIEEYYPYRNRNVFGTPTKVATRPATVLQSATTTPTYVSPRRPLSSLALHSTTKTKIPYPLATIWTNNSRSSNSSGNKKSTFHLNGNNSDNTNCNYCRNIAAVGDAFMRMPANKSNLATTLIMEPVASETSLPSTAEVAAGVECNHQNTHNNTSTANANITGGRFQTIRHKLALITQKPSTDATLERSLSLRKNFKYSNKTAAVEGKNKTNNTEKLEGNHNSSASIVQNDQQQQTNDIASTKGQQTISKDQSIKSTIKTNMEQQNSSTTTTDGIVNGDINQDFEKMSLNQNGIHTSSAVVTPTTTPSSSSSSATAALTASATASSHGNTPHTRPLTLVTATGSTTTNISYSSGGGIPIKTPRSPKPPAYTGTNAALSSQQQQHNHNHHLHQESQTPNAGSKLAASGGGLKPTPKTPPVTPDSPTTYLDDDLDSLYSYTTTSGRSTMSCEHPYVARNGTTFSGRKMKYVVHCSNYAGQVGADYLTPTQRAQRQIRRLKELLCAARQDLEQKDSELLRLTREVVELRLFKASLSSPDERSASSDAVTVREAELKTSQDVSPIVDMVDDGQKQHSSPSRHHHGHSHHIGHAASASPTVMTHASQSSTSSHHHHHHHHDMQSSFADSGHFEDLTSSSVHSKDSSYAPSSHGHHHGHEVACGGGGGGTDHHHHGEPSASTIEQYELQRQELIRLYEQRIEDLIRSQDAAAAEVKRSNNDRIEALLQKLAECNTRYADIVPDYEHAKERIRELEKQLEDLQRKLVEHEEKQKQMYLHMYQKGQEAERIARADQALELAHRAPQNKVSINELLHQLQSTQDELENIRTIYRRLLEAQKNRTHVDPEVTLQFLKSAVYYFLTDKENSQGHLQAIESILEFSEAEKQVINKARTAK
ncbi:GRIP domain-containing protein quick-to-court isoform X2 [Musca autumnalis]|uniref:GRIP domain-containing protein quick-to-court isoform X2 n=1 Tax=Musca autumnalis TaxID=221902 RepID=UPI003CF5299A